MKTLRLLNFAAFLLLFTPFFQMCSDDGDEISGTSEQLLSARDSLAFLQEDTVKTPISEQLPSDDDGQDQSALEAFWELITVPGDNFTTTAFGLFVITVFDLIEGHFSDIWVGSILIIMSLILTCATLIKLMKKRLDRIVQLVLINLVLILAAFGTALLKFDSIAQVKWGYYLYLGVTLLLFIQARITVPRTIISSNAPVR